MGDVSGDSLFQPIEALEQLREALEDGDGAEPDAVVESGRAGDHFAGRNVVGDGRLRGENDAVADHAVAGDADLTGENDVVADDRGAGKACLRADQRVVADTGAVADLDEIVDLGAVADFGCADGSAVNGGVGLYVNAAADANGAGLRNLLPVTLLVFGKAEAVRADDDAIFERDVVAEDAVFADDRVRVREEVAADLNAGIEHDVGQDGGVRADADARADDGVWADVGVVANDRGGIDDCRGMNSRRIRRRLVEEAERAREGVIGILDAQRCGGNFLKFGLDEDGSGLGGAGESGVLYVRNESDFSRAGFFNAFDAGNFKIGVAAEFRAKLRCQFAELH